MADYQTKTKFVDAVQFDSSKPLPPNIKASFVLVYDDGRREPIFDTDWVVTDLDGKIRRYTDEHLDDNYEPKVVSIP